jgi:hypothetical protein
MGSEERKFTSEAGLINDNTSIEIGQLLVTAFLSSGFLTIILLA